MAAYWFAFQTPIPGEETLLSLSEKGVGVILALSILLLFVVAALTREQQAKAAREAAKEAVRTADVTALRTGLEARTGTVAQLQAQVAELAAVVEAMRVALGLDEPPDGRGNA